MFKTAKTFSFVVLFILFDYYSYGQTVRPLEITVTSIQTPVDPEYLSVYKNKKEINKKFEKEELSALAYFPELKNVHIKFRLKRSYCTLKTKPGFMSMFMPEGHRTYIIAISNHTIQKLTPLIFEKLPENAKIGVLGHELSHVTDFSNKSTWQSLKIALGHFSKRYLDSLEFNTDKICIEHGLGKELEAWSSYIRNTMHTTFWRGSDFVNKGDTHFERYMNPSTIEKLITEKIKKNSPLIKNVHSTIADKN